MFLGSNWFLDTFHWDVDGIPGLVNKDSIAVENGHRNCWFTMVYLLKMMIVQFVILDYRRVS